MSENKLVGSLVLRTIDINPANAYPSVGSAAINENEYGRCAGNGGFVTWKNINLRTCLGELYYKYDRFNLKLTAVQMRHSATVFSDGQMMIYMSGLPFSSGSGYNTRLGPTNQAQIGIANIISGIASVGVTTSILSGLVSFYKQLQNTFDITVELKNSSTNPSVNGYSEKTTQNIGHWSIICDIYGIE